MDALLTARPTRKLAESIIDSGIDGLGPLSSAKQLAAARLAKKQGNRLQAAKSLIRSESLKGFGGGFVTGLGGLITMPVTVPSAIVISWIIEARLSAAIAVLFEHDIDTPNVREQVLQTLLDEPINQAEEEQVDEQVDQRFAVRVLQQIPGAAMNTASNLFRSQVINRGLKFGVKRLSPRALPVLGGFVSGRVDAKACRQVGARAMTLFGPIT